jgi:hypothetical protein
MAMSEVASRGEPELCRISVSSSGAELGKAVGSVRSAAHERAKGNRFRGNAGEDIKGVSRNNVREVRDYGNAVPGIGSLVGRGINGWGRVRKSRGRVRT